MNQLEKHRQKISLLLGIWGLLFLSFLTFSNFLKQTPFDDSAVLLLLLFAIPMRISSVFSVKKISHNLVFSGGAIIIVILSGSASLWKILVEFWWFFLAGYSIFYIAFILTDSARKVYQLKELAQKISALKNLVHQKYLARIEDLIALTHSLEFLPRTFFHSLDHYLELVALKDSYLKDQEETSLIVEKIEQIAGQLFEEVKYHAELAKTSQVVTLFSKIEKNCQDVSDLRSELNTRIVVFNLQIDKVKNHPIVSLVVKNYTTLNEIETWQVELSVL